MSQQVPSFIKKTKDGVVLKLHVQPRASKNKVVGLHGNRLKIAIQAPPANGKANKAVQQLLSKILDLPKSNIVLRSGITSRKKTFLISGISSSEVLSRLKM